VSAAVDGLRGRRPIVDADDKLTDTGRASTDRIEVLTDESAARAYDALSTAELDELLAGLELIAAAAAA